MRRPLVDIIIPSYNSGRYLSQAIDSALAQTYRPISIIVVDDGSTDNTKDIALSYKEDVKYVYQENKGLPGARNTGVRSGAGKYVYLLDGDDIVLPRTVERLVAALEASPDLDVAHGRTMRFRDGDLGSVIPETWRPDANWPDYLAPLSCVCPFSVHSALTRRKVFEERGYFPEEMTIACEDWAFWLECVLEGVRLGRVPIVCGLYREHGDSMCSNMESIARGETILITRAVRLFQHYGVSDPKRLKTLRCGVMLIALKWVRTIPIENFQKLLQLADEVASPLQERMTPDLTTFADLEHYPVHHLLLAEELYGLNEPLLAAACLVQSLDLPKVLEMSRKLGLESRFVSLIDAITTHVCQGRCTNATPDPNRKRAPASASTENGAPPWTHLEELIPVTATFESDLSYRFAMLFDQEEQYEKSMDQTVAAICLDPNFAPSRLHYSLLLERSGQFQEALEQVEAALFLDPLVPLARLHYSLILMKMSRYRESLRQFSVAAAMDRERATDYLEGTLQSMLGHGADPSRSVSSLRPVLRLVAGVLAKLGPGQ